MISPIQLLRRRPDLGEQFARAAPKLTRVKQMDAFEYCRRSPGAQRALAAQRLNLNHFLTKLFRWRPLAAWRRPAASGTQLAVAAADGLMKLEQTATVDVVVAAAAAAAAALGSIVVRAAAPV